MCHFFYDDSQILLSGGETVPRCPGTSMETSSSSAMRGELWTSLDERRTGEKWRTNKKLGRKWDVHGKIDGLVIFMEKNMKFDGVLTVLSDFPWIFPWMMVDIDGSCPGAPAKVASDSRRSCPGRRDHWGPLGIAPDGKL